MLSKVLVIFIIASAYAHLPSYITPCSRKDPNLNACCLKKAKEVYPKILKGNRELDIPPLNPLKVPELSIDGGKDFQLVLKDLTVDGFQNGELQAVDFDLEKNRVRVKLFCKQIILSSDYKINGKVLLLPITGEGKCKIDAVGGTFEYIFDYKIVEKNGEKYSQFVDDSFEMKLEGAKFDFGNLFGGDKKLAEPIHITANENWQDVIDTLGSPIKKSVREVIKGIVKRILENVPCNELFSD